MTRFAALLVPLSIALTGAETSAQSATTVTPIQYRASFENSIHHEAVIEVDFSGVGPGTLELRMSRTSPGRYSLHEFAKNVYDVRITDREGRSVDVYRPNPHQWNVDGHGGEVHVRYTLFGDRADGTYTGIDETHAHLSMPATFMWARGLEDRPIEVRFDVPEGSGWSVATQLEPTADPFVFRAPGLAYFFDSPTIVTNFTERSVTRSGQRIRIALQHLGTDSDADRYAEGVWKIVDEAEALFGEFPTFDYGVYTFLAVYVPWASGDGMEHRNSTLLASTRSIAPDVVRLWGTVAHEFIHAWNVERIRPHDIEPFDFEEADMSRGLWFAEGFTDYLDDLLLVRSGLIDRDEYASRIGRAISTVVNSPGRRFFSPVEMSMQAPFSDRASSADPTNRRNTFISYYTWGSIVGLALDRMLRERGLEIDTFLQSLWARHGKTEVPYEVDDLERVLADVTHDPAFSGDFFDRFVRGREIPPLEQLLGAAGIELVLKSPGRGFLGDAHLEFEDGQMRIAEATRHGSPLYTAGLDRGDVILEMDGRAMRSVSDWERAAGSLKPGQEVRVRFVSRGTESVVTVRAVQDPELSARIRPALTDGERRDLDSWLSGRAR